MRFVIPIRMWLFLWTLAVRAEPSVATNEAGVVHAVAVVPRPPGEVLAFIQDPNAVHAASGDAGKLKAVPNAGCYDVTYTLANVVANVSYLAHACPTQNGFRSDVVESPTFRSQKAEWSVRPVAGGAEVTYVYEADIALPLPKWLIRHRTESAIRAMMTRIAAKFGG